MKPRMFPIMSLFFILAAVAARPAPAAGTPKAGGALPAMSLAAPANEKDAQYLGRDAAGPFTLADVNADLILIEIVGVYCPLCHKQAPLFNALFHRLEKNPDLKGKVLMLAVAAGATPMEAEYLRKQFKLPFPVITDTKFDIHKQLGEPRTPFTMLATPDGRVKFAHLGVITDMNGFMAEIRKHVP